MANIKDYQHTKNWFNFSWFYEWVVAEHPWYRKFVEVGVWKGHSITKLASLLLEREGATVWAVDLWEQVWDKLEPAKQERDRDEIPLLYEIYKLNLEEAGVRHMIHDIQQDSAEAALLFENGTVDFVFIDADHRYHAVRRDVLAWLPKVRLGGMLAGHDWDEVKPAVLSVIPERFITAILGVWYMKTGSP